MPSLFAHTLDRPLLLTQRAAIVLLHPERHATEVEAMVTLAPHNHAILFAVWVLLALALAPQACICNNEIFKLYYLFSHRLRPHLKLQYVWPFLYMSKTKSLLILYHCFSGTTTCSDWYQIILKSHGIHFEDSLIYLNNARINKNNLFCKWLFEIYDNLSWMLYNMFLQKQFFSPR